MATPARTGVVCPSCQKPIGVTESRQPAVTAFWCPGCNYRWSVEKPGARPH